MSTNTCTCTCRTLSLPTEGCQYNCTCIYCMYACVCGDRCIYIVAYTAGAIVCIYYVVM